MTEETPPKPTEEQDTPTPATAARQSHGLGVEFRFLSELKRRNVGRVAILYLFVSWLIIQPVNVIFDMLDVPGWANRLVVILLAIGFPVALIFAWAFELTPEGIKPASEVEPQRSITAQTGQRLNRAIIVVLALALAYFVVDKFWLSRRVAEVAPASDKSIAVLPFVDMSENKDQEYFSDGLSEQLINLITQVPELRVPARTSSFYFKGKQATIAEIARALNVAHVLEGSVRKSGDTLRISAQLIRVDNGYHLWSATYDRKIDDIFKIQDDIAGAVVNELKVSLLGTEAPHATPTANTEAYTLYLKGRDFARRFTRADTEMAIGYLQQAVEADPNFAPAWSALAEVYGSSFSLFGTRTDYERARKDLLDAAGRALALDPQLADAHVRMATLRMFFDIDLEGAQREYARAMELDPRNADVLTGASFFAIATGDYEEAAALGQKAVERDPLAVNPYGALGFAEFYGGRPTEAEAVFRKVLDLNPVIEGMHYRLGLVLLARDPAAALAEMEREPDGARRQLGLALAYDALGRKAEADAARAIAETNSAGWAYQIAEIYAHRNDKDQAFAWLDRAYANHDTGLPQYVKGDPLLESLRGDPRYAALLQKMKLPL